MSPLTITIKAAAELLAMDRNRVSKAVKAGQIPGRKIGGRWVVLWVEFETIFLHPGNPQQISTKSNKAQE